MAVGKSVESVLNNYQLRLYKGVEFWGECDLPEVAARDDDGVYTVKETDRVDTIAREFYGSETLWWVIARRNNLYNLPEDLEACIGKQIFITKERYVLDGLGNG